MKKDYLFTTSIGKFLFKNTEWHKVAPVHPVDEDWYDVKKRTAAEDFDYLPPKIATYTINALQRLIEENASKHQFHPKLFTHFKHITPEDFYFCLNGCRIEFSCPNKPVVAGVFDYDCLTKEQFEAQKKREQDYRAGRIPPEVDYEFPITIAYKGKGVSCLIRFRDTVWFEKNTFTVELAEGEAAPEGWEKNAYGEYEFPEDDLWEIESLSAVFPAYNMECSPYRMWQRLGEKQPTRGHVFPDPAFEEIWRYMSTEERVFRFNKPTETRS